MIAPVFLPHLGCRDRCIYCNQAYITDVRDPDLPRRIRQSLPTDETCEVGLFGGNIFGLEPVEIERLFQYFEGYRSRITGFRISTKPVPINKETPAILKRCGVTVIELGIPTFNDETLSALNRKHTAQDFLDSFRLLVEQGFQVAMQVMVGLPGESMHDIRRTVCHMLQLRPCYIRIYPLLVLSGTPLQKLYEKGMFLPVSFEEAVRRTAVIWLNAKKAGIPVVKMGLTDNEVLKQNIVAGPYHPAFGYVVKSEAFYLAVKTKIEAAGMAGDITISLNRRDIPHLLGDRRQAMQRFQEAGIRIMRQEGPMETGSFGLVSGALTVEGTIYDALPAFMLPSGDPIISPVEGPP